MVKAGEGNPLQRSEDLVKYMAALVLIAVITGSWIYGCGYAGSTVSPNGYNSPPTVSAISPNTALAGGAAFTLTITGTNFVANSIINFGGAAPATPFVSSTQLTAAIPAASIASSGTLTVSVTNPGPSGGASNAVNF